MRLHPADVYQLDDDDEQQHREDRERDRGALAQQARADTDLVGVVGKKLRRVCRSAAGQHIDKLKIGERLNNREQHDDQGHRQQQRPRDVPEALPGPRAVNGRGFVQFGADRLQSGKQADRIERNEAPDIDDYHRYQSQVRVAQPVDPAVDDPELEQQVIDDAEGGIEHPLPSEGRQHGRDDERQEYEGAGEGFALEVVVQQQRQPQTQREFEDCRDERVEAGVPYGDAEDAVIPHIREILQPDKMPRNTYLGVGNRQLDTL